MPEKFCQISDHRIAYVDRGRGEVVLLLHGFAAEKEHFTLFSRYFGSKFRIVAPDLPGFGHSSQHSYAHYGLEHQAKRLKEFLEKLQIKKCHIIGNSMGGHLAAIMAVFFPQVVESLVLISAAGVRGPKFGEHARLLKKGRNILIPKDLGEYKDLMNFLYVSPPKIKANILEAAASELTSRAKFHQKVYNDLSGFTIEEHLSEIKAATLVIWGREDRVFHHSCSQVFAKKIPNCRVEILDGVGHMPMIEAAKTSAGLVKEFLGA